jgi:hypothetical protein
MTIFCKSEQMPILIDICHYSAAQGSSYARVEVEHVTTDNFQDLLIHENVGKTRKMSARPGVNSRLNVNRKC